MLTRSKRSHSFSSIQNIQGVSLEKLKRDLAKQEKAY